MTVQAAASPFCITETCFWPEIPAAGRKTENRKTDCRKTDCRKTESLGLNEDFAAVLMPKGNDGISYKISPHTAGMSG